MAVREPGRPHAGHGQPGRHDPPVGPRHAAAARRSAAGVPNRGRAAIHARRRLPVRRSPRRARLPLGRAHVLMGTPRLRPSPAASSPAPRVERRHAGRVPNAPPPAASRPPRPPIASIWARWAADALGHAVDDRADVARSGSAALVELALDPPARPPHPPPVAALDLGAQGRGVEPVGARPLGHPDHRALAATRSLRRPGSSASREPSSGSNHDEPAPARPLISRRADDRAGSLSSRRERPRPRSRAGTVGVHRLVELGKRLVAGALGVLGLEHDPPARAAGAAVEGRPTTSPLAAAGAAQVADRVAVVALGRGDRVDRLEDGLLVRAALGGASGRARRRASAAFAFSACSFCSSSWSSPMRPFISRRWVCCWSDDWRMAAHARPSGRSPAGSTRRPRRTA